MAFVLGAERWSPAEPAEPAAPAAPAVGRTRRPRGLLLSAAGGALALGAALPSAAAQQVQALAEALAEGPAPARLPGRFRPRLDGCRAGEDNETETVVFLGIESLEICKVLCVDDPGCGGIEYSFEDGGRCDVWRPSPSLGDGADAAVAASADEGDEGGEGGDGAAAAAAPVAPGGAVCLSYVPEVFVPMDGGIHRACRGENLYDIDPAYFSVRKGTPSLRACQSLCTAEASCQGIEYHPEHDSGRCELWTRPEGIRSTSLAEGYTCMLRSGAAAGSARLRRRLLADPVLV